MTVRNSLFVAMMILAAAVSPATAATITYGLRSGGAPGTYELTAQVSEDTFGLAQYAVTLQGATTIEHVSPSAAFASGAGGPIGFTFARSANGAPVVSAAQDITAATPKLVYNIGKQAGALADAPNGPLFGATTPDATGSYGLPVVLAKGTFAQSAPPVIVASGVDGLIFSNQQGSAVRADGGILINQYPSGVIPEPATVALGGLAMVGLLGMRRRSA